ncbi:MAG: flagellar biosynthesis protein FlhF, partial [Gammaproteobacteria bacterium]|nr:flagellar biosynthesis protein FlhF [Gammaproteobacteria bacterium]
DESFNIKPVKRPYRTYADIPDEPLRHEMKEDVVSFLSQSQKDTIPEAFSGSHKNKDSISGIFDNRNKLNEPLNNNDSFTSSLQDKEFTAPAQRKAKKSRAVDYSKYIVEDEQDEWTNKSQNTVNNKAVPDNTQAASNAETEELKKELRALRSMMETQMSMMSWEKQKKQNPVTAGLLKRLSELGLTVDISKQVLEKVTNNEDVQLASKQAINALINLVPVASDDILKRQGIVALVGATGVGKTTTIAKLAARYVMAHGADQIALITLDNYRIGAQEQLYNYSKILNVAVHNAKDSNELHKVLQNLYDKKLILIDTAGMSQKDLRICEQFNTLKQGADEVRSYVVLAANAQTSALDEIVRAFKETNVSGCILTKLDESASLGGAISMLVRHKLPVAYISDGQAVPEDLHISYARELVARALELLKERPEQVNENDLAIAFNEGLINAH